MVTRQELEENILTELDKRRGKGKQPATTLDMTIEELNFDSLDRVEMVMHLEEKYDLDILDKDAETLTSGRAIVDYIAQRKGYF